MLQFIDSGRFMASSLSNLVNNLSEGIHRIKCKYGHDDNKCDTCGIKCKYCVSIVFLNTLVLCNKNFQGNFDKKLNE